MPEEVRIVDPTTGGEKGSKLSQIGLVDPVSLWRVGEVAGFGAEKYAKFNFLKGYQWDLSYSAMMRHFEEFWMGNDYDDESGLLHLAHGTWHGLALISFYERGLGTDTRPPKFEGEL
jgi:hypothetical protein